MIPVRNVYYLLAYAWDQLQTNELTDLESEADPGLPDMLGWVLANGVNRLVRRGLDRDYVELTQEIPGVRGRIDFSQSIRANSFANGRTVSRFEELRHDVLQNQILKASLLSLLRFDGLEERTRARVRLAYRRLQGVSEIRLSGRHFGLVQVHRNNAAYRFLLHVSRLIFDNLLVSEMEGSSTFYDFRRDDAVMWRIFERFVLRFFDREQDRYQVDGQRRVDWANARALPEAHLSWLPAMKPDVILRAADRRIVLDTKYYKDPLPVHHDRERLVSSNLYQLYAYLENLNAATRISNPRYEGMLLYAVVKKPFSFDYSLNGHKVMIRSIDLDQDWTSIHEDLLALVF